MVPETSLYRRHRPQTFDEVVGQEHVVRTLRNAVEQDRVHHAYLFVGSRGTGKTSMAKILARCLNCERGPTTEPCGECESCVAIAAGTSLDVIEMDAASNRSVDDIRDLRERVGYMPAAGRWKVYIIDEAHMLTREAWNAFLKTLEEPPPNTVFVLATTEAHKVMPTIVDRCQRFDFQRPAARQIAEVLERVSGAEGIEIDEGAVGAISRAAGGSFRDALGTLDQLVAYGGSPVETDDVFAVLGVADSELIFAAAGAIADGNGNAALEAVERLSSSGRDVSQFMRDLVAHLRQLLVIRTADTVPEAFAVTAADEERLRAQARCIGDASLVHAIDELSEALSAIREWGDDPRTSLELALLRSARPDVDPAREALAQRVERLERGFSGPVAVEELEDRSTRHSLSLAARAEPVRERGSAGVVSDRRWSTDGRGDRPRAHRRGVAGRPRPRPRVGVGPAVRGLPGGAPDLGRRGALGARGRVSGQRGVQQAQGRGAGEPRPARRVGPHDRRREPASRLRGARRRRGARGRERRGGRAERGRARRATQGRVRRRGDERRGGLAVRGGQSGGMNLNQLMKQAQQMQAEMMKAQEQLKDEVVDASAGGGMVKVKMSGDMRLLELTIDPEAIDPDDAEVLADMVTAAVNEALRAAQALAGERMGGIPGLGGPGGGGPGIPGLPGQLRRAPEATRRRRYRHDDAARADQPTDRRAREAPRGRSTDRPATRIPHPALG